MRYRLLITILKKHWLALLIVAFAVLPTAGFILVSSGLLVFTFWNDGAEKELQPVTSATTSHLTLIAHGVGDTPLSWAGPLSELLEAQEAGADGGMREDAPADNVKIVALDWNKGASSTFRCSVNGKRTGEILGQQAAQHQALKTVHLIGHSCGAFVVYGFCTAAKEQRPNLQIQTTYLDPVSIYGALSWNYGLNHFGSCADFSDAYIDSEDNVPGSNVALPHAHTFDVTNVRKLSGSDVPPHVWPTQYYQLLVAAKQDPQLRHSATAYEQYPVGEMQAVNTIPHLAP